MPTANLVLLASLLTPSETPYSLRWNKNSRDRTRLGFVRNSAHYPGVFRLLPTARLVSTVGPFQASSVDFDTKSDRRPNQKYLEDVAARST